MTDAIIYAPWQSFEGRYLAAAHAAGLKICAVADEQSATSRLYRDPDSVGILWARGQETAATYVRQARLAGVRNVLMMMLHADGTPEELAASRAAVLMAGADDCQPSTIEVEEIAARLKAMMLRGPYIDHFRIEVPGAIFSIAAGGFETVDGRYVRMSTKLCQVMTEIGRRPGQTRTKQQIMDALYGGENEPEIKIVDVLVCKLRQKIVEATGGFDVIETIWGRGYQFVPEGFRPGLRPTRSRCAR